MLWNTFSCACQQPSSLKIETELQVQGHSIIQTNQINKCFFMFLGKWKSKMVKIFWIFFCYVF